MDTLIIIVVIWFVVGFAWGLAKCFVSPERKELRRFLKEANGHIKSTKKLLADIESSQKRQNKRNPAEVQKEAKAYTNETIAICEKIACAVARMTPEEQEKFNAQEESALYSLENEWDKMRKNGWAVSGRELEEIDELYERHFQHRRTIIPTGRLF